MDQPKYDIEVKTMLLPGIVNPQKIIEFLDQNHRTISGTTTMFTFENYEAITKVGTVFSCIISSLQPSEPSESSQSSEQSQESVKKPLRYIGTIFNTLLTIRVDSEIIKSSYTTYLCVEKTHRKKNYSRFLIDASDRFCTHQLKSPESYFLSYKNWGKGLKINSFYRVLNYKNMKKAGFGVVPGKKNKVRSFYSVKKIIGFILTSGINVDVDSRRFSICWNPNEYEKKRFSEHFSFYTVQYQHQTMVFSLFPLKCFCNETNKICNIGMLSYFYISDPSLKDVFFKIVLQIAEEKGYDCVYGYTLGDVDSNLVESNSGHITNLLYYLNFFKSGIAERKIEDINLLIY